MGALDAYGPFDSGPGANFYEDRWRKMMRHMLGSASGVIRGFDGDFGVYADSSGMQVKVRTGQCFLRGHWGETTTEQVLPIAASDATNPRYDLVVLRADFLNNLLEVAVLTGTPAASPAVPVVTQNTSVWETSLALVGVPAGATTVAASNVGDRRVYTSATGRYRRANAVSIANDTMTKVPFDTTTFQSGDLVVNSAGTEFTLNRSGLWSITYNLRWGGSGAGTRNQFLSRVGEEFSNRISQANINATAGDPGYAFTVSALDRFVVGDRVAATCYQNSGAALSLLVAEQGVNITFAWVGP
jgi:hypothetical protein